MQDDLRLLEDIHGVDDVEDLDLDAHDFDAEPIKKDEVVGYIVMLTVGVLHNDYEHVLAVL